MDEQNVDLEEVIRDLLSHIGIDWSLNGVCDISNYITEKDVEDYLLSDCLFGHRDFYNLPKLRFEDSKYKDIPYWNYPIHQFIKQFHNEHDSENVERLFNAYLPKQFSYWCEREGLNWVPRVCESDDFDIDALKEIISNYAHEFTGAIQRELRRDAGVCIWRIYEDLDE